MNRLNTNYVCRMLCRVRFGVLFAGAVLVLVAYTMAGPVSSSAGMGEVWAPLPDDKVVRISGIYPHLVAFNIYGECGIGAIVPWADKLWFITYPPSGPNGGMDKLYTVDKNLKLEIRPESVGGTHANRLIHRESNQLIIGPYFVDSEGRVRAADLKNLAGRLTATARHLTDPANKVYFFAMEGAVYEVDVHTLAVTRLFEKPVAGWHGKGAYTSQGRFVLSNNGESAVGNKKYEFLAGAIARTPEDSGILADWDGQTWRAIQRRQFTEVTGPDGILGARNDNSPVWSMGWDKRSVLLEVLDNGQWHTFRLPKASYTQEDRNGHYTEWPRIREVTEGRLLAHMQCLFYDFPKTFSKNNYGGLKPISTYTRMPVDYCAWNGQIVMGRDDASIMDNELAGQSHSALWFGSWSDLENLGAPMGWGGPWMEDDLKSNEISDPFLINGFSKGVLHLKHNSDTVVDFDVEVDCKGDGKWRCVTTISVPPRGYVFHILHEELKAQWIRLKIAKNATQVSAFFFVGNPAHDALPERFQALADVGHHGDVIEGVVKPACHDARRLLLAMNVCKDSRTKERKVWGMDGRLELQELKDSVKTKEILSAKYGLSDKADFMLDAASVIITLGGKRYRLPRTDDAYDRPLASGWPRGLREVVTERSLLNAHGTFYEVPRSDAGGFRRMRPICTHGKQISDFTSWRGLLVLAGVRGDARLDEHCYKSADGRAAVWFGEVDDLWRMGKPVGKGGPWKDSDIQANKPSDPYLMTGYDRKKVEIKSDKAAMITLEVDFDHHSGWHKYKTFEVKAGGTVKHEFDEGFSVHWIRAVSDTDCRATVWFVYE